VARTTYKGEKETMKLCGRPGCNGCPDIHLLPDGVTIELEFDDGGMTQMTKAEFDDFKIQLAKVNIKDL